MSDTEIILRRPEVERRVGLSRSQIYLLMSKNQFPRPVKLGARAVGWFESEIGGWMQSIKDAQEGRSS